jgi:hypothetical protein
MSKDANVFQTASLIMSAGQGLGIREQWGVWQTANT